MDKLNWISSGGGPLVLISEESFRLWSGTLNRKSYLEGKTENADDFMDPDQADYGRACSIQDYLGVLDIGNDKALVLGDEALATTTFISLDNKFVIARWYYGESTESVEHHLYEVELDLIDNWEFSLSLNISSSKQFLFDSAFDTSMLDQENEGYLHLHIQPGLYHIWTCTYQPDQQTQLLLHRFESENKPAANI